MNRVIAFVGMPGSGKGTCADYLKERYDWPVIHFGSITYEEVQRRGLDNVKDEAFVREDLRKQEGPAVYAKRSAVKADKYFENGVATVVFDGLYSWSEYKFLDKKYADNLIVIAITAPKKIRRQRVLDRNDTHRKYTLDQIIKREFEEIENIEKGGPIAMADYTIVNDGTKEDLIKTLERILKEVGL